MERVGSYFLPFYVSAANPSLTAAVVVLTGLVGANFVQAMLDRLGLYDPIARGLATASRCVTFFPWSGFFPYSNLNIVSTCFTIFVVLIIGRSTNSSNCRILKVHVLLYL